MTRRQIEQLNRITGRLEAFQHTLKADEAQQIKDNLSEAKSRLLTALSAAEHGARY